MTKNSASGSSMTRPLLAIISLIGKARKRERSRAICNILFLSMLKCIKQIKFYRKRETEEGRVEKSKQSVSGIKYLIFVRGHGHNSLYK
jgi:hypothetical protein